MGIRSCLHLESYGQLASSYKVVVEQSGSLHTAQGFRLKKVAELARPTAQRLSWKKVAESGSHTNSSETQLEEGS